MDGEPGPQRCDSRYDKANNGLFWGETPGEKVLKEAGEGRVCLEPVPSSVPGWEQDKAWRGAW